MIRRYIFVDRIIEPMYLYDIIEHNSYMPLVEVTKLLDTYSEVLKLPRSSLSSTTNETWVKRIFYKA